MRATALVPLPCQASHLAPRISRWTASRSSEAITLHPNTEVSAASNFIAMWNQSRMRQVGCAQPLAAFSNSPAPSVKIVTRAFGSTPLARRNPSSRSAAELTWLWT